MASISDFGTIQKPWTSERPMSKWSPASVVQLVRIYSLTFLSATITFCGGIRCSGMRMGLSELAILHIRNEPREFIPSETEYFSAGLESVVSFQSEPSQRQILLLMAASNEPVAS